MSNTTRVKNAGAGRLGTVIGVIEGSGANIIKHDDTGKCVIDYNEHYAFLPSKDEIHEAYLSAVSLKKAFRKEDVRAALAQIVSDMKWRARDIITQLKGVAYDVHFMLEGVRKAYGICSGAIASAKAERKAALAELRPVRV